MSRIRLTGREHPAHSSLHILCVHALDLMGPIAYLKCLFRHVAQWESTTLTR